MATNDGKLYVEFSKGMYGLPQAGIIAQELLEDRLIYTRPMDPQMEAGLWTHRWRPIAFSLIVDDFGVKYIGKEYVQHLIDALGGYEIEIG